MKNLFSWLIAFTLLAAHAQPVPIFLESIPFDSVMTQFGKAKSVTVNKVMGRDTLLTQTEYKGRINSRYWIEHPSSKQWMTEASAVFATEKEARLLFDDWIVWMLSENAEPVKFGETDTTRKVIAFIPHSDTYMALARGEWPTYLNQCRLELMELDNKQFEVRFIVEKRLILNSTNGR